MHQTIETWQERPLLKYAISKLNPEIFSHPVWIRFGRQEQGTTELINDLSKAAERLETEDPGSACQILLLCAVYQKDTWQNSDAIRTIQRALDLAEELNLKREMIWAIWGACSVSIHLGNYEQAESRFLDLQSELNKQNEWVLADLIEVLRQSILHLPIVHQRKQFYSHDTEASDDLLTFGFDWLQNWGRFVHIPELDQDKISGKPPESAMKRSTALRSFFPFQHWQVRWHSLLLAIRGELRLQWGESYPDPMDGSQSSFWDSALSWLHLYKPGQKIGAQIVDNAQPAENAPLLPPVKEDVHLSAAPQKKKPAVKPRKGKTNRLTAVAPAVIPVTVHMLGPFSLTIGELELNLPASRGLSLLKYLLLHHRQNISREILMDVFWGDAEPETARNNLNVAMHSLRKSLRTIIFLPVIIYEDGCYGLDPNLQVWLDVEVFEECVKVGKQFETRDQLTAAVSQYEMAISLYQGDFLEQSPFEEWTIHDREYLRAVYLDMIDRLSQIYFRKDHYAACITICQRILSYDPCREDAYCLLMRCYSRQGQNHLALRQYQNCVKSLRVELDVDPDPETTKLYNRIRRREQV